MNENCKTEGSEGGRKVDEDTMYDICEIEGSKGIQDVNDQTDEYLDMTKDDKNDYEYVKPEQILSGIIASNKCENHNGPY